MIHCSSCVECSAAQVRRLLGQFQKAPSPEKPVRKRPPGGRERDPAEEASRNVMAMARKFNAMVQQ
jgi:hypothetical protein